MVWDGPTHNYRYSLDSSKICEKLDWEVENSLEDALQKTVKWYLENEEWWQPLIDEEILSPEPWKEDW